VCSDSECGDNIGVRHLISDRRRNALSCREDWLPDNLRSCLPNNLGGVYRGSGVGSHWLEVGKEIVGFSTNDWVTKA
jgi:hypothetical protein